MAGLRVTEAVSVTLVMCVAHWCSAQLQPTERLLRHTRGLRVLQREAAPPGQLQQPTSAFLLPLQGRYGVVRRRQLLRAASMPVDGSVREVGYFYVTMGLGTPSRSYQLIIDTGSTITYVPCSDCKHCGKHQDPPYNPKDSSTSLLLSCNTPKCNCGSPSCQCFQDRCYYSRTYAERSSSEGFMLEDVMAFADIPGNSTSARDPVRLVFGCEASETGEIYRQTADGIVGMGNNNNALQSQLVEQKVIADTFALCFGYPNGGAVLLGDVALSRQHEMVYTPLKPGWQTHYYTVVLERVTVNGRAVAVDQSLWAVGYGGVLDSGTTFTYFPTQAFNNFVQLVDNAAQMAGLTRRDGSDPQYNDVCWAGAPQDVSQLSTVFPKVEMVFEPGVTLLLKPLQYLFVAGQGSYCLGVFDNGMAGTLLGGITVRNVLVQYDRRNQRAGFLPLDSCDHVNDLVNDISDSAEPEMSPDSQQPSQPAPSGATAAVLPPASSTPPSVHLSPSPDLPAMPPSGQPQQAPGVAQQPGTHMPPPQQTAQSPSGTADISPGNGDIAATPPVHTSESSPNAMSSGTPSPPVDAVPGSRTGTGSEVHSQQPPQQGSPSSQHASPHPRPPLSGIVLVDKTPSSMGWSLPLLLVLLLLVVGAAAYTYRRPLQQLLQRHTKAGQEQDQQELVGLIQSDMAELQGIDRLVSSKV